MNAIDKFKNQILHGDCLEMIRQLPDKSVNCVITSPPYWQLRDYGWSGQWGLEKTFQEYLEHLWQLIDEVKRILANDGTVWVNLGDTYGGTRTENSDTKHKHCVGVNVDKKDGISKCLILIPHRFAIGCIDRGWIMRNDIIWAKRNGMPESVTDRFSKKHEYIFFMVKQEKYYFDLDGTYNTKLIDKPIIAGCPKGGIILDPFCGTGTTLLRAKELERDYIGIEGNPEYVKIAESRLVEINMTQFLDFDT